MRCAPWLALLSGSFAAAAITYAGGCVTVAGQDCTLTATCPGDADAGSGGRPAVDCSHLPIPMDADAGPNPACGVFACPNGPAGGKGTQDQPYPSLAEALTNAKGKAVYACNMEFDEAATVTVPPGATIYGGLDATKGWAWTTTHTTVKTAATVTAQGGTEIGLLLLDTGTGPNTTIEDVDVTSPTSTVAGVSSIAVLVNGGQATLSRCNFTAGAGAPGAKGVDGNADPNALVGVTGDAGNDICAGGADNNGPAGPVKMCTATGSGNAMSMGGKGGDGGLVGMTPAGKGGDASPLATGSGNGGAGEVAATPGPASMCATGEPGLPGAAGMAGPGAPATPYGGISATGFTGVTGSPGVDGSIGYPGGGGGAALGAMMITCGTAVADRVGAAGGAGGTGGCGGQHGSAGGPGGASIALASLMTSLLMNDVTLVAQAGGAGGPGGAGQAGGMPGTGGMGGLGAGTANPGCNGGHGGMGGAGGPGGGGMGGHSVGIAFTGAAAPSGNNVTMMFETTPAPGGAGGTGAPASSQGASGQAAMTLGF